MKNLKKFETEEAYANASLEYPTVSYVKENEKVFLKEKEQYILATYKPVEYTFVAINDMSKINSINVNGENYDNKVYEYELLSENISFRDDHYGNVNIKESKHKFYEYCKLNSVILKPKDSSFNIENITHIMMIYIDDSGDVSKWASTIDINNDDFMIDYENNQIIVLSLDKYESIYDDDFEMINIRKSLMLCTNKIVNEAPYSSGYTILDTMAYVKYDGVILEQNVNNTIKFNINSDTIDEYLFDSRHLIINIDINAEYITSIGERAFYNCTNLTSIEIPNSVTSIGYNTFQYCTSLTSVTIPSSVTSINSYAFDGCYFYIDNFINNSSLDAEAENYWRAIVYDTLTEDGLYIRNNKIIKVKTNNDNIIIPSSVTSIDYWAFRSCYNLTSVTIPSSVTYIGKESFNDLYNLSSVMFEDCSSLEYIGYNAFNGTPYIDNITDDVIYICNHLYKAKTEITSCTILNDTKSIVGGSFSECSNLTSITIPSGVTSIGEDAFSYCTSLTSVTFEENSQCTTIDESAFSSCSSLTSVIIPSSVTRIDRYAFYSCDSLTSITIPSSVTKIGEDAFSYCYDLTNVTFEEDSQCTTIDERAFQNCSSLTSITIPSSVTTIGNDAFRDCIIHINNFINNSSLDAEANDYWGGKIYDTLTEDGLYIRNNKIVKVKTNNDNIIIPNSVTSIGYGAFDNCTSLTSITIPNSVTSIGDYAFIGCENILDVTLPNGITKINYGMFYSCYNLTSITIPSSVTYIDEYIFSFCDNLISITCLATTAPIITNETFSNMNSYNGVLKVLGGSDYSSWMEQLSSYNWTIEYI